MDDIQQDTYMDWQLDMAADSATIDWPLQSEDY